MKMNRGLGSKAGVLVIALIFISGAFIPAIRSQVESVATSPSSENEKIKLGVEESLGSSSYITESKDTDYSALNVLFGTLLGMVNIVTNNPIFSVVRELFTRGDTDDDTKDIDHDVNQIVNDLLNNEKQTDTLNQPLVQPSDNLGTMPLGAGDPWWNTNWQYRKNITIDYTKVDADLSNFPVMVSFDSDSDLAGKAQSDGDDIVFTDDSGNKLNHEIESFNGGSGELVCWVNVTSLSDTSDTTLYMYYGNPTCGSQQNPAGVWDSNFVMIQHLNESGIPASTGWEDITRPPNGLVTTDAPGAVVDDRIYITGGYTQPDCGDFMNSTWEYNTSTDTWNVSKANMSIARWGHIAVPYGNDIYVFGGHISLPIVATNMTEKYNTITDTWTTVSPCPDELIEWPNGHMGVECNNVICLFLYNYTFAYYPETDTYIQKADVPARRRWGTCAAYNDEYIFIIGGGVNYGDAANTNYRYNISTDSWDTMTPMPVKRWGQTRENPIIGDTIYVTHGKDNTETYYTTCYAYNITTDSWTQKSSAPSSPSTRLRDGPACGVVNGKLYVLCGRDAPNWGQNWSEVYDPEKDTGGVSLSADPMDSTSNNNDGTWEGTGGDTNAAGKIDGADEFDGSTNYIDCGSSSTLSFGNGVSDFPFTVEAWINSDDLTMSTIMSKYTTTPSNKREWILYFLGGEDNVDKILFSMHDNSNGKDIGRMYNTPLTSYEGEWIHIVGTYDGAGISGGIKIYLNGNRIDDTDKIWEEGYIAMGDTGQDVYIGRFSDAFCFDGTIDEVRISSVARTTGWINTSYLNQHDPGGFYSVGAEEIYGVLPDEPVLSDENPTDKATDVGLNPLLSIYVEDPQGDSVSVMFMTNESGSWQQIGITQNGGNGTYTQATTMFDSYSKKYWWSVNATDPGGSGNWTNETYHFTTEIGEPVISNENPADGAVGVDLSPVLSVHVVDHQGDLVDVSFRTNASGSWVTIGSNTSVNNVTVYCDNTSLMSSYNTRYWWSVNATDPIGSGNWTNETYCFVTIVNNPPVISNVTPVNGSLDVSISLSQLSFNLSDPEGDLMDYYIVTSPDIGNGSGTGMGNGPVSIGVSNLSYDTTYYWYVNVTDPSDSRSWTNKTYWFTTQPRTMFDPFTEGWQYRKSITIDHTKVTGNSPLINFPVLIDIIDSDLASKAQDDGDDIIFMNSSGVATQFKHEIEQFDDSTGHLVAWVRIPSLSDTEDTVLYMYYGKPGCESQENVTSVWDSHYKLVQHLDETTGTHYDSTRYGNEGTPHGGITQDATGQIDGADSFDGMDDYVDCGNDASLSYAARGPQAYVVGSISGAHNVVISDVDGDGKKDLVATGYRVNKVVWYKQLAATSWSEYVIDNNLLNAHDIQVGDIDDDGKDDVVGIQLSENPSNYNQGNGAVIWYKKPDDPTGAWTRTVIAESGQTGLTGARSCGLGDIDSDGDLDIAVAVDADTYQSTGRLFWYQNPGGSDATNGSLWNEYLIDDTQRCGADAQIGDLDNDGNPDIVYSAHDGGPVHGVILYFAPDDPTETGNWVRVYLSGDGIGLDYSYHNYIVDFDDDGYLDVLVAHWRSNKISWYQNPGSDIRDTSNWVEYVIDDSSAGIQWTNRILAYDIDLDGDLDIATVSDPSGSTGWLMWYERPDDPTDISAYTMYVVDNDGSRIAWAHDGDVGDIDGDGTVDMVGVGCNSNKVVVYYDIESYNYQESPFSIEAWINSDDITSSTIVAKYTTTPSNKCEYIFHTTNDDKIFFELFDNSEYAYFGRIYDTPLTSYEGQWIHLVGTYDRSGNSPDSIKIYLNGERVDDAYGSSSGTYYAMEDTGQEVTIGNFPDAFHFDGTIDEVRISDVVRSAGWINTSFMNQNDPGGFYSVGVEETVVLPDEPVVSSENPSDGSVDVGLSPVLSVHVVDHQGDNVDVSFRTNASGSWQTIGSNNSVNNVTVYCDNTGSMNSYSTTYWWSVNATDPTGSGNWTNETYHFTTEIGEPIISNENPADGANHVGLNPVLSVHVVDHQGDNVDVSFRTNASGSWLTIGSNTSVNNVTVYCDNTGAMSSYNTKYWWSVNCSDGTFWANETYSFKTMAEAGAWWDTSWSYRKSITIDHSKVQGNSPLVNFPVLVDIVDSDLAAKAQTSGDDIVFTDDSCNQLNHEIEFYEQGSGHLVCWVNVASLSDTSDTTLYMYYGNAGCGSQQNPAGVWDSNYVGVWHFNEESGIVYDSTSNDIDCTASGTVLQDRTGKVGRSIYFDGSSDYISCSDKYALDLTEAFSVTTWVKYASGFSSGVMLTKGDQNNGDPQNYQTGVGSGGSKLRVRVGTTNTDSDDHGYSAGTWYYSSYTFDDTSNNVKFYINGNQHGSDGSNNADLTPNTGVLMIGGGECSGSDWSKGDFDELRLSKVVRSAGWINTSYTMMSSPSTFLSVGSEETSGGITVDIPLYTGWNLITVPVVNSFTAMTLAENITDSVMISRFDAENQTYRTYIVGGPPGFDFPIQDGYGYFVLVSDDSSLNVSGYPISSVSVDLEVGWNMIGWYHIYNTMASSLGENITGCIMVSWFDSVSQTFKTFIVGGPPGFDFSITPGMGLFVLVDTASTWHGEG